MRVIHERSNRSGECIRRTFQHVGVAAIRRDGVSLVSFFVGGSIRSKTLEIVGGDGTGSGLSAILVIPKSDQNVRVRSRREVAALLLVVKVCVQGFLKSDGEEKVLLLSCDLV